MGKSTNQGVIENLTSNAEVLIDGENCEFGDNSKIDSQVGWCFYCLGAIGEQWNKDHLLLPFLSSLDCIVSEPV